MKKLILIVLMFFITVPYLFSQTISYTNQIKPLFDKYGCTGCHGGSGGLFVSPYASLFTTGDHKPVVVAGDTNSVLIKKIKGIAGFGSQMPLGGPIMAVGDLNTIIRWVKDGAPENSTSVDNLNELTSVHSFSLSQNYPNPFNPTTTFRFTIPTSGYTKLSIFNLKGQKVANIVNGYLTVGEYIFTWNAWNYASGIYFYKLQSQNYSEAKKLLYLK